MKLFINMVLKFASGFALIALMLFGTAQTFAYPGAWILMTALALPMIAFGVTLLAKDPETLKGRLDSRETEKPQIIVVAITSIVFIAMFVLAGLDYRYEWLQVPFAVSAIALMVMLAGYGLFVATIFQNSYARRTVNVQEDQKVIDTGVYRAIRHPMYIAALLVFCAMPLILGSWIAMIPACLFPPSFIYRLLKEEELLREELSGYREYMTRVKHRLIPFVW
jgi:protein-S-isoprenylcysteine O-methyltransferase Ste14